MPKFTNVPITELSERLKSKARMSSSITVGLRLSTMGASGLVAMRAIDICAGSRLAIATSTADRMLRFNACMYCGSTPLVNSPGPHKPWGVWPLMVVRRVYHKVVELPRLRYRLAHIENKLAHQPNGVGSDNSHAAVSVLNYNGNCHQIILYTLGRALLRWQSKPDQNARYCSHRPTRRHKVKLRIIIHVSPLIIDIWCNRNLRKGLVESLPLRVGIVRLGKRVR